MRSARIVYAIMGGVLVWGLYHVWGAVRSETGKWGIYKGLIILVCVLSFLLLWHVAWRRRFGGDDWDDDGYDS